MSGTIVALLLSLKQSINVPGGRGPNVITSKKAQCIELQHVLAGVWQ